MKLKKAVNIEDLHRMARRRLPKVAFDFLEGGVEDELGLSRNESALARFCLMPRYLVDVLSATNQPSSSTGSTPAPLESRRLAPPDCFVPAPI